MSKQEETTHEDLKEFLNTIKELPLSMRFELSAHLLNEAKEIEGVHGMRLARLANLIASETACSLSAEILNAKIN